MKYVMIVWILCAVFNWGAYMGDLIGHFPFDRAREHSGIVALYAIIFGPFGTILSPICTNFYEY